MKCISQINSGRWCQETYETGSPDCRKRAKDLRQLGYSVIVSPMGEQVTQYGVVRLTQLTIYPGQNPDTTDLPEIEQIG